MHPGADVRHDGGDPEVAEQGVPQRPPGRCFHADLRLGTDAVSYGMSTISPRFTPPSIVPPSRPLGRVAFVRAFVRNLLEVVPQAAYEEDFVALEAKGAYRIWVPSPALIKAVLIDARDKFQKLTQIRLLRPLLAQGILTSQGPAWRGQPPASAPMFRPEDLAGFLPTFVRVANDVV